MWLKMWCISTVVWFVLFPLQIWLLACKPFSDASDPPPEPRIKSSYSFGKTFLGLDKCNACIGTSMCKKFFKDEIRFENWLCPRLKLPSDYLQSYSGNYTDDSESWRQVEISRLMSKHQHDLSDKRICASISKIKSCSIEQVLMKTERFRKWSLAKRLTPDLVQGLPSPILRCPSQRLLDRIVRRYAEVLDAGSVFMDHFTDRDKMRLLYTLSINAHPIVLQIFPGSEGWPFPKYLGACGRLIVSTSTIPLKEFYNSTAEVAADLGYQLLRIIKSMRSNDMNYLFYFTHIEKDTFGVFSDGRLFIKNSSTVGIIDMQEGCVRGPDGSCSVWIVGHSFVRWAEKQAASRHFGTQLGLDGARIRVIWVGKSGMRWGELLVVLSRKIERGICPDLLVIHLGENDLVSLSGIGLLKIMKMDLVRIKER
ncbi:divergent protein kinase domain 2B isoform X2 [Pleurodeles waltl]|uniref:divergent protein kinase domain 2B isoform X2 n=1 Tax=Pleurodeles waltl TaxID=8319 RepID=UPI0037099D7F